MRLHIERLVIEGVPMGPGGADAVRAAVADRLTATLAARGVPVGLSREGNLAALTGGTIRLSTDSAPASWGTAVAEAIYAALGAGLGNERRNKRPPAMPLPSAP